MRLLRARGSSTAAIRGTLTAFFQLELDVRREASPRSSSCESYRQGDARGGGTLKTLTSPSLISASRSSSVFST
eukprot:3620204-Pyramimonas_sp.AAC.1